jgi:hypothetical protein
MIFIRPFRILMESKNNSIKCNKNCLFNEREPVFCAYADLGKAKSTQTQQALERFPVKWHHLEG